MKKGKIIALSIVGFFIVLLVILSCTLFNLKTVDVEFLAQAENPLSISKTDIYDAGDFKLGTNLLFNRFDKNIQKIEKECASIKVVKVVKKFPNKIAIYVIEREKQIRILGSDGYNYIFDDELKVINKTAIYDEYKDICEVKGYSLPTTLGLGDFLQDKAFKPKMIKIMENIYTAGRTNIGIMSNITFSVTNDELQKEQVLMEFKSGAQIKIVGLDKLAQKVLIAVDSYNNLSQDVSSEQLRILKLLPNANATKCIYKYAEEW